MGLSPAFQRRVPYHLGVALKGPEIIVTTTPCYAVISSCRSHSLSSWST